MPLYPFVHGSIMMTDNKVSLKRLVIFMLPCNDRDAVIKCIHIDAAMWNV